MARVEKTVGRVSFRPATGDVYARGRDPAPTKTESRLGGLRHLRAFEKSFARQNFRRTGGKHKGRPAAEVIVGRVLNLLRPAGRTNPHFLAPAVFGAV